MIIFVIYDKQKGIEFKKIISNILTNKKEKYQVHVFTNYTNEMDKMIHCSGKKIYLLNEEINGLKIAMQIRQLGDWNSQIMLLTNEKSSEHLKSRKLLMLDTIYIKEMDKRQITTDIKLALHILKQHKDFKFFYNNEYYQIPYDDILYFEKDLNNNYVSIITIDTVYRIKESIKKIELKLTSVPFFFKTHQSCIVNLQKIIKIDFNANIIYFKKNQTNLLSRNKKKELKERIEKDHLYETV